MRSVSHSSDEIAEGVTNRARGGQASDGDCDEKQDWIEIFRSRAMDGSGETFGI